MFRHIFIIFSAFQLPLSFGKRVPVNRLLVGKNYPPPFPAKGIVGGGLPECRNCKHFMPHNSEAYKYNLATCLLYGEKNVISGIVKFEYAEHVRNREEQCSKEGRNFEPIDPTK
jgi:hypothetical protein